MSSNSWRLNCLSVGLASIVRFQMPFQRFELVCLNPLELSLGRLQVVGFFLALGFAFFDLPGLARQVRYRRP